MTENRSYNPKDVLNNDRLDLWETIMAEKRETELFWGQAAYFLTKAGIPGPYVVTELTRYMNNEKSWPEGVRDYRLMMENLFGQVIERKNV